MAGANYMGGRINATKARVRDTDGRLQRSHFGKQKLAVLSKGLGCAGAGKQKTWPPRRSDVLDTISLAHAQRTLRDSIATDLRPGMEDPRESAYKLRSSPSRKRRKLDYGNSHAGSSNSSACSKPRSRILRELDLSEPISMREEMNRLLRCPDFAGLSNQSTTQVQSPQRSISRSTQESSPYTVDLDQLYCDRSYNRGTYTSSWDSPVRSIVGMCTTSPTGTNAQDSALDTFFLPTKIMNAPHTDRGHELLSEHNTAQVSQGDSQSTFEPMEFGDEDENPFLHALSAERNQQALIYSGSTSYCESDVTAASFSPHRSSLRDLSSDIGGSTAFSSSSGYLGSAERYPGFVRTPLLFSRGGTYTQRFQSLVDSRYQDDWLSSHGDICNYGDNIGHQTSPSVSDSRRLCFPSASLLGVRASPRHVRAVEEVHDSSTPSHLDDLSPSDLRSRPDSDSVVQETLIDSVNGQLFEGSDPWATIKARLDLSLAVSASDESLSKDASVAFKELALANDRTGVGYDLYASADNTTILPPSMSAFGGDVQVLGESQIHQSEEQMNFHTNGGTVELQTTIAMSSLMDVSEEIVTEASFKSPEEPPKTPASVHLNNNFSTVVNGSLRHQPTTSSILVPETVRVSLPPRAESYAVPTEVAHNLTDECNETEQGAASEEKPVIAGPSLFFDNEGDDGE